MANSDDDVREIQLSGKQLVFLFMAVTVVSVVIFLCGVLVGRGVQARVTEPVDTSTAASSVVDESADPTASADVPVTPPSEPTAATGLVYEEQLAGQTPPAEKLKPRQAATAPKPAPAATPTPAPATAAARPSAPASTDARPVAFPEPRGDGFAIQVAALTGRAEAEAVAARLKGKGYAVYLVVSALPGQSAGYKVRVGKFKARAEAEKIALRLEREEQFKPWITR